MEALIPLFDFQVKKQSAFPPGSMVYICNHPDNQNLITSHGTVEKIWLKLYPATLLFYEVKESNGKNGKYQAEQLRFASGCTVRYKNDQIGSVLGLSNVASKNIQECHCWYSIEILDSQEVLHQVKPEDLSFYCEEVEEEGAREVHQDATTIGQRDENQDVAPTVAHRDETDDQSIEPIPEQENFPVNEVVASSHMSASVEGSQISMKEEDTYNSCAMNQRNESRQANEADRNQSQTHTHINQSIGKNENHQVVPHSSTSSAHQTTEDQGFEPSHTSDVESISVGEIQQKRKAQDCLESRVESPKRRSTYENDFKSPPAIARNNIPRDSMSTRSSTFPTSPARSNPRSSERIRHGYSQETDHTCTAHRTNILASNTWWKHKTPKELGLNSWSVVNGEVMFWCGRCQNGMWTNHNTADHGLTRNRGYPEKQHFIVKYKKHSIGPSQVVDLFKKFGSVFYSDFPTDKDFGILSMSPHSVRQARDQLLNGSKHDEILQIRVSIPHNQARRADRIFNLGHRYEMFRDFKADLMNANIECEGVPRSQWYDGPCCPKYHILGNCIHGCPFAAEADHRDIKEDNVRSLLEWCKSKYRHELESVRVENANYKKALFAPFKNDAGTALRLHKHSLPVSSMCVFYHVVGRCNSSCFRQADHSKLYSDEDIKRLYRWCEESCGYIDRDKPVVNESYKKQLFSKFESVYPNIMKAKPVGDLDDTCLRFHIEGKCNTSCSKRGDHITCSEEKLQALVEFCEKYNNIEVDNKHYQTQIFKPYKSKITDALRSTNTHTTPLSSQGDVKACLYYHVMGKCIASCVSAVDHKPCSTIKLKELLQWCRENIKVSKMKIFNPNHKKAAFDACNLNYLENALLNPHEHAPVPKSTFGDFGSCVR